jgi:hypothetical protein
MKLLMCALLIVAISASATVKTGGTGMPNPWSSRGTYTVVDILAGGLAASYGMAIMDSSPNSIWILNWSDVVNNEFNMVGGSATGNTWAIGGGIDADDQAFCEYGSGNQFFMTDFVASLFGVYQEDGTWIRNISGPSGYTNLFGIGAGHGMIYIGSPNESTLAWGAYTGTESTITWSEMAYESVYGLAVYGDYLFVACGTESADNIFIHSIAADGTPSPTPVWSTMFLEELAVNGGIDYDGTYLWVYPQNTFLYKLSIDFDPQALNSDSWAGIKASF